jgi:hypothetical protein
LGFFACCALAGIVVKQAAAASAVSDTPRDSRLRIVVLHGQFEPKIALANARVAQRDGRHTCTVEAHRETQIAGTTPHDYRLGMSFKNITITRSRALNWKLRETRVEYDAAAQGQKAKKPNNVRDIVS